MTNDIQKRLFSLSDKEYKKFNSSLIPTVDKSKVIGVRTPALRKFAKELKADERREFLRALPHEYYEENNLHGYIIEGIQDYDKCIEELEKFLPYIDNWATCDTLSPKVFRKNTDKLLKNIKNWLQSSHVYTVRFGVCMLMKYYLEENFSTEYHDMLIGIQTNEYYVNMVIAWYFATALSKQYEKTLPYVEKKKLPAWTHNKAIQKAVESYRIPPEQKAYLKTLKIN